jgi:tetratricopeptide (TPR) repeat protein
LRGDSVLPVLQSTIAEMNQYEDHLRTLDYALKRNPNDARTLRRRGETYRVLRRYDEALKDLNRALDLKPADAVAHWSRGETYRVLKRYDEALKDLNQALDLAHNEAWTTGVRGRVFKALGRTAEARQDLELALRLDSTLSWVEADLNALGTQPDLMSTGRPAQDRADTIHLVQATAPSDSTATDPASILATKIAAQEFDVFLCHNSRDKLEVKTIGQRLKELGVLPWLDEWELRPGFPWQEDLERQIGSIKSAAVFVGKSGLGPWQEMEQEAFLHEFTRRRLPVIPVILESLEEEAPALPAFLARMAWVDFRDKDPDPMDRLVWGILGERRG